MGCLSQRYFEQIKSEIPEIDGLFGVDSQAEVIGFLTAERVSARIWKPVAIC
jgi:tRNA A37 methylthiotransferase MiaB